MDDIIPTHTRLQQKGPQDPAVRWTRKLKTHCREELTSLCMGLQKNGVPLRIWLTSRCTCTSLNAPHLPLQRNLGAVLQIRDVR